MFEDVLTGHGSWDWGKDAEIFRVYVKFFTNTLAKISPPFAKNKQTREWLPLPYAGEVYAGRIRASAFRVGQLGCAASADRPWLPVHIPQRPISPPRFVDKLLRSRLEGSR